MTQIIKRCTICSHPFDDSDHVVCEGCRAYLRKYRAEKRQELLSAGKCVMCKGQNDNGLSYCNNCRGFMKKYNNVRAKSFS